jgi:signal transduction histidine kinase
MFSEFTSSAVLRSWKRNGEKMLAAADSRRERGIMTQPTAQDCLQLLEDTDLGVLAFSSREKRVLFQNRAMRQLLAGAGPMDDSQIGKLFFSCPSEETGNLAPQRSVTLGAKSVSFSICPAANGWHWVLVHSLGEEPSAQRIRETARLMEVLDYAFFSLAHELGNPINSIKMTLDVLINNFNEYADKVKLEYLVNLHAAFSRMEELLKAIKSFNMFEHLTMQATAVQSLLQNLLQMLKNEIDNKNITLAVEYPPQPEYCQCDPRALQQALLNIISNAIDALAGQENPRIAIQVRRNGRQVEIRVRDNGHGIPLEKQKEIFLPFFSGKPLGIGLGLTIVKKLITQMNGTVEIQSQSRQGAEALIRLAASTEHEH